MSRVFDMANETCFRDRFDPQHPVCASCERQRGPCRRKKAKGYKAPVRTWPEGKTLVTSFLAPGLNAWNNKPRLHYLKVRKQWEAILTGTVFLWGKAQGKRRLTLKRVVTSRAHLIKDDDNLEGALKPIKDVLTREKVLIDDSPEYLERNITQTLGPEQRTELTLEDLP